MQHSGSPHPGATLGRFIEYMLLKKNDVATHLGISRGTLFRVIGEEGRITPDLAMRLERAFHIDAGFWLKKQADFDVYQARMSSEFKEVAPMKMAEDARDALAMAERDVVMGRVALRHPMMIENERGQAVA